MTTKVKANAVANEMVRRAAEEAGADLERWQVRGIREWAARQTETRLEEIAAELLG